MLKGLSLLLLVIMVSGCLQIPLVKTEKFGVRVLSPACGFRMEAEGSSMYPTFQPGVIVYARPIQQLSAVDKALLLEPGKDILIVDKGGGKTTMHWFVNLRSTYRSHVAWENTNYSLYGAYGNIWAGVVSNKSSYREYTEEELIKSIEMVEAQGKPIYFLTMGENHKAKATKEAAVSKAVLYQVCFWWNP